MPEAAVSATLFDVGPVSQVPIILQESMVLSLYSPFVGRIPTGALSCVLQHGPCMSANTEAHLDPDKIDPTSKPNITNKKIT